MTADPFARLDAAYALGALESDERSGYEEHLATCEQCRASLADVSAVAPLLAGLEESDFVAPVEAPAPVPDTLLPSLLRVAARERTRRRWRTAGLGALAAACAIALIAIVVPSGSAPQPASRAMAALVATPIKATVSMRPRAWGTEIDLNCWYRRGATVPLSDRVELLAQGADGATYDLGSWQLAPGLRVRFTSGIALSEAQIMNLEIAEPDGTAILALSTSS